MLKDQLNINNSWAGTSTLIKSRSHISQVTTASVASDKGRQAMNGLGSDNYTRNYGKCCDKWKSILILVIWYLCICCHIDYFLKIFRLFLHIKLLWQSKWPWRWNNDNTHQCAQPPTALQNMRSIMLNIKQIVSRQEENGVYSPKRGLMEHVKRRKVGVYYIAPRGGV